MAAPDPQAAAALREAIFAEARRQKEDLLRQARQEAEALIDQAVAAARQERARRLAAAQAEAQRRAAAVLATVDVEAGRRRAARIEALLQAIHEKARERLRARRGFDFRRVIVGLSAEALAHMDGDHFQLRLSVADQPALGDGLAREIQTRGGRKTLTLEVVADANLPDGDLLLANEARGQVWNLSLEARLERCWPELRRQIAAQTGLLNQGGA